MAAPAKKPVAKTKPKPGASAAPAQKPKPLGTNPVAAKKTTSPTKPGYSKTPAKAMPAKAAPSKGRGEPAEPKEPNGPKDPTFGPKKKRIN